jgi:hypothetical protein
VPVWIAILAAVRASNTERSVDFGALTRRCKAPDDDSTECDA